MQYISGALYEYLQSYRATSPHPLRPFSSWVSSTTTVEEMPDEDADAAGRRRDLLLSILFALIVAAIMIAFA